MKIGVWCLQLWISSSVIPPQHSLSNSVIYLFIWGGETPPCCNRNLQTNHTGGVRDHTNTCVPTLSVSITNHILSLHLWKTNGGGGSISLPCVRPIVGNRQLPKPGVLDIPIIGFYLVVNSYLSSYSTNMVGIIISTVLLRWTSVPGTLSWRIFPRTISR